MPIGSRRNFWRYFLIYLISLCGCRHSNFALIYLGISRYGRIWILCHYDPFCIFFLLDHEWVMLSFAPASTAKRSGLGNVYAHTGKAHLVLSQSFISLPPKISGSDIRRFISIFLVLDIVCFSHYCCCPWPFFLRILFFCLLVLQRNGHLLLLDQYI